MNKNTFVFLLVTNKCNRGVLSLFKELQRTAGESGDVVLLYHHSQGDTLPGEILKVPHHVFTDVILTDLNYRAIGEKLVPGNNHFPLLDFFLQHSYDFYWVIEDDVRFNGRWDLIFTAFDDIKKQCDFITSHIRMFRDEPFWHWWLTLQHESYFIPFGQRIRSFNPIYRISNLALQCIHAKLSDKWIGHHEVLLPTLLSLSGFDIVDFGGNGQFVPNEFENRFYTETNSPSGGLGAPGSMRYRPVMKKKGPKNDLLYHPVKSVR